MKQNTQYFVPHLSLFPALSAIIYTKYFFVFLFIHFTLAKDEIVLLFFVVVLLIDEAD